MTQFDEAAEHASFDVRTEYAPLLATHGVVISEKSAQKITEIITEHYAEIEAVHGKLVELAVLAYELINAINAEDICLEKNLLTEALQAGIDYETAREKIEYLVYCDPLVKSAMERSKG